MQLPRALTIMGAGLAAGWSARIAFVPPGGAAPATGHGFGKPLAADETTTAAPAPPGPRPDTFVILAASGASRLRLLMAWLPGADDVALLRMADEMVNEIAGYRLDIRLLMARWAQRDPLAAAAWVETLPPGEPQQWAAANLATNWGRHDPAAAASWIEHLPAGPAKALAQKQFATLTTGQP